MTVLGARCSVLGAAAIAFLLVAASVADAQVAKPQRPKRPKAVTFGGVLVAPLSLGTATASFERPDGTSLVVFRAENDVGPGLGAEFGVGFEIRRSVWAEMTGGWIRSDLRTRVSGDVESAPDQTLTESLTRFTVEGAGLWYFRERGKTSYFLRGGAGWMRELTGAASLALDGVVSNAGIGLRHWWRDNARGKFRRLGIRAEFRLNIRSTSLSQVESARRVSPSAAGKLVIGF